METGSISVLDESAKLPPKTEIEILSDQVSTQNQTLSDLMDILFTTVPELENM